MRKSILMMALLVGNSVNAEDLGKCKSVRFMADASVTSKDELVQFLEYATSPKSYKTDLVKVYGGMVYVDLIKKSPGVKDKEAANEIGLITSLKGVTSKGTHCD